MNDMTELEFTSTLSYEEIEKNFSGVDFFTEIMSALEEALAYEKAQKSIAALAEAGRETRPLQ